MERGSLVVSLHRLIYERKFSYMEAGMKYKLIYFRNLDKSGKLTKSLVDKVINDFHSKMSYYPKEVIVRMEDINDEVRSLVTFTNNGLQPGHILVGPVIDKKARIFEGERVPA